MDNIKDKEPLPPPPPPPNPGGTGSGASSHVTAIADDLFWLKHARDSIEGAKKACDDGAQNLLRVIAWIWPIYTGTFATGSFFAAGGMSTESRVLFSAPILLIFLAYWSAQYSLLPVFTRTDPRIPYEIRKSYNKVMEQKKCRIQVATVLCLLAVISLSAGLFLLRVDHPDALKSLQPKPGQVRVGK